MSERVDNPYKLLFSLGILSAFLGVAIWPLFQYQLLSFYPKQAHLQVMFFGFFWSFVAGFLMTAIPRMTGSSLASRLDVVIAASLIVAQTALNFTTAYSQAPFLFLLQLFFLIYFIVPRVLKNKKIPFEGFLFLPFAFLMAAFGVVAYHRTQDTAFLRIFSGEAFLTNLIIGLGSRLVPALSRLPSAFMHPGLMVPLKWRSALLKVSILNLSFAIEAMGHRNEAYLLRFVIVGYVALSSFGLLKKGNVFSMTGMGLKISVVFLLFSYLSVLVFANHSQIASFHWLYIGGFALATVLIATRVTLAHSQTNLDYELNSKLILSIILFLSGSVLLRWIANQAVSGLWINLSLILFMLGLFAWLYKHLSLVRSSHIQKD